MAKGPPSDPGEQMWRRVKATVKPLKRKVPLARRTTPALKADVQPDTAFADALDQGARGVLSGPRAKAASVAAPGTGRAIAPSPPARAAMPSLDTGWEKRLRGGRLDPDFTIDLHGHHLVGAYSVLMRLLDRAVMQGARVILVVAGKARGPDEAPRGAIRRELATWLAHGPHAGRILAVRNAHPRHGGAGALYILLRRARD